MKFFTFCIANLAKTKTLLKGQSKQLCNFINLGSIKVTSINLMRMRRFVRHSIVSYAFLIVVIRNLHLSYYTLNLHIYLMFFCQ